VIRLDIDERLQNDGSKTFAYHFSRYLERNYDEIFGQSSTGFVCGYLDSLGNLWIGTNGNGVVRFSRDNNEYRFYNLENGLASNVVSGIIEDNEGFIWLATGKGLSRVDPAGGIPQNLFDWEDSDYPAYRFDWWDVHRDPQGYLYFGVLEDPMFLDPDDFLDFTPDKKMLVLSDLKINNISQIPGLNGRYPYLINHLTEIRLNHRDHILSIGYNVLDYLHTGSYNFRYMLEGFDKEWIDAGRNTFLSYSNLPAGEYSLILNYSDIAYFDKNNAIVLDIRKSPPPWNTWWAWLGYFFVGGGIAFTIIFLVLKRQRIRKQLDEEHKELIKIREIEEAKTRFFTQISHEIRTPLSLILQPIEELSRGETKEKQVKYYGIIRRNARRLNKLMDQILDFSRIEAGKMTLEAGQYDIMSLLRLAVANFSSLAESKNISLVLHSKGIGSLNMCFDQDKMEKVIYNLISNALKFTPPGGEVTVTIEKYDHLDPVIQSIPGGTDFSGIPDKDVVFITVEDTGIGIPQHLHERIFNRFDRGDLENNHAYDGMGLGLAITRELVELHKGRIWVQNNPGTGSAFFVVLPLGNEHAKDQKKALGETPQAGILSAEEEPIHDWEEILSITKKDEKASILFIEDNDDMRRFFHLNMQDDFLVMEAENGGKGLSLAREHIPDIIISDIMMPGMDGVEVVRSLKSDRRTCHIPVILLTAKSGKDDKVNALKTGADDYIIKPFDIHELKYRIRNQLNQLARLREQSIRAFLVKDPRASFNSRDDNFISELTEIVYRHLEDPAFSVIELSREMGVSRTQLFRKMKAITGKQPSEFIRCIRVRKAAELLKAGSSTITEIAYDTGFNSISYFSRCFKEIYQVTPSEYMQDPFRNKNMGLSV
jgi:signal transduction histidine kinase/DNA-binding response OmpR family regulator